MLLSILVALYTLAKVFFNQFAQRGDCFGFVGAVGPNAYLVPLLYANLHQVDSADLNFGALRAAQVLDGYAALEGAPGAIEERRGSRMKPNRMVYSTCCFCHTKPLCTKPARMGRA
jgi:hypothetical protein